MNIIEIKENLASDIKAVVNAEELEALRVKYLGRKGIIKEGYALLGSVPPEQKPIVGKTLNELKQTLEEFLNRKTSELSAGFKKNVTSIDVTMPGVHPSIGHAHILTQTIEEISAIFEKLGFVVAQGPEMETEFYNFEALNIPADHPSRDSFDTFFVDLKDPSSKNKDRNYLLRSQTSPGQVRMMQMYKPPLAVVIPGRVYRPDAVDASHSFMFHQIEGLLVDENVTFADLKGLLFAFCKKFFGENIKMRFRPHFFPFTEPSAEVDISWEGGKKEWLEIMGCGLVHPHVFETCGYPKGKYSGLAFGMGVERMAMLRCGISDIRLFFENDVRFLNQF